MIIEGRVVRQFIYMTVMGPAADTPLGNFVIYLSSGEFAGQTVAVSVLKSTLVSIAGVTHPAAEFNLPEILREPLFAIVDTSETPQPIITDGSWTAIAQSSAIAAEIAIRLV